MCVWVRAALAEPRDETDKKKWNETDFITLDDTIHVFYGSRRCPASLSQMTIKLQNCMKRLEVECDNYSERDCIKIPMDWLNIL